MAVCGDMCDGRMRRQCATRRDSLPVCASREPRYARGRKRLRRMLPGAFDGAAGRRRACSRRVKWRAGETGLRQRERRARRGNMRRKDFVRCSERAGCARARRTRSGARAAANKIADECLILRSRRRTTRPRWHVSVLAEARRRRSTSNQDSNKLSTEGFAREGSVPPDVVRRKRPGAGEATEQDIGGAS
jgi:hypothetical protein